MTARAREIIDFWTDVAGPAAKLHDRPVADVRAAELVRPCQDMASAEGLSKIDLEKEIHSDLYSFFRRQLIAIEIEDNGWHDHSSRQDAGCDRAHAPETLYPPCSLGLH
jgi:hypothetical protein